MLMLRYLEAFTISKDAKILGLFKYVKLEFWIGCSVYVFQAWVRVGYEILPVYEFKVLPKCCFKCRSLDHLQKSFPRVLPKSTRCGGPRIPTKDEPCITDPNYANYGQKYPSYSFFALLLKIG